MFNYEEMFKPFEKDGATIEGSIQWLKKTTGADQFIIDQAIAETMDKLSKGEKFELPCPCGCELENVHTHINHYMLSCVYKIQKEAMTAQIKVIKDRQKILIEEQLKRLSNFDKEYDKMINGNWFQKNCPTFSKWIGKGK